MPDCKGKPCDDALRCIKAGRCCYKSSAEQAKEVLTSGFVQALHPQFTQTTTADSLPNILREADSITGNGGERNDSYDHPRPNFTKIAQVWTPIFGVTVTPQQVALAMIVMKAVRENHKHKRDNLVDIAGYARCIERLEEAV